MGKIDAQEAIELGLDVIELTKKVTAAYKAMPPKAERKAVDYAVALGLAPGTPGYMTAELYDKADEALQD